MNAERAEKKSRRPVPPLESRLGRPSEAEISERIDRVIGVATELFLQRGYDGTSTDQISKLSNVSKKSLYSWFPNKLSLFSEVIRRQAPRYVAISKQFLIPDAPLEESLYRLSKQLLDNFSQDAPFSITRLVLREGHKHKDLLDIIRMEHQNEIEADIRTMLEGHLTDGASRSNIGRMARMFYLFLFSEMTHNIARGLPLSDQDDIEEFAQILAQLFAAHPMFQPSR